MNSKTSVLPSGGGKIAHQLLYRFILLRNHQVVIDDSPCLSQMLLVSWRWRYRFKKLFYWRSWTFLKSWEIYSNCSREFVSSRHDFTVGKWHHWQSSLLLVTHRPFVFWLFQSHFTNIYVHTGNEFKRSIFCCSRWTKVFWPARRCNDGPWLIFFSDHMFMVTNRKGVASCWSRRGFLKKVFWRFFSLPENILLRFSCTVCAICENEYLQRHKNSLEAFFRSRIKNA